MFSSTDDTVAPVSTSTPWATSSSRTRMASSGSRGGSTWGVASTIVTAMPFETRFSAISRPMNPAPITTARRGCDVDVGGEPLCVLDRAKRPDPVVAGDRRPYGCRARAEHELVVADDGLLACERRPGRDGVPDTVDGDHLVVHPHVQPEAVEERLGRLQGQVLLVLYEAANEVRQAAVGERDVARALETMMLASASRRRRRVAVDIPPATPPTITTFLGEGLGSSVIATAITSHHLTAPGASFRSGGPQLSAGPAPTREPGPEAGRSRRGRASRAATATLDRRHMAEDLLDVGAAPLPGGTAASAARDGSAHTP